MDKILAIKEVRNLTGFGLKESKDIVEHWQATGEKTPIQTLIESKLKEVLPRSEQYHRQIRDRVKGLQWLVSGLAELCEGDFGEEDLSDIREQTGKIADDALLIRDRMITSLEECLYKEDISK